MGYTVHIRTFINDVQYKDGGVFPSHPSLLVYTHESLLQKNKKKNSLESPREQANEKRKWDDANGAFLASLALQHINLQAKLVKNIHLVLLQPADITLIV